MSFGKDLDSQATLLQLGCGWSKPFLKPTKSTLLSSALCLSPWIWIQEEVLKWWVCGRSASPSPGPEWQTEAQISDSWRPSSFLSRKPHLFTSHFSPLYLFLSLFSALDDGLRTKAEAPNYQSCLHVALYPPSLHTITALQRVGDDLPR